MNLKSPSTLSAFTATSNNFVFEAFLSMGTIDLSISKTATNPSIISTSCESISFFVCFKSVIIFFSFLILLLLLTGSSTLLTCTEFGPCSLSNFLSNSYIFTSVTHLFQQKIFPRSIGAVLIPKTYLF